MCLCHQGLLPREGCRPAADACEGGLERDGLVSDDSGTYRIVTVFFDHAGNEVGPAGIVPLYDTGCTCPTFGIVRPAVTNTRVDMLPYGQSVLADAIQAVDLTFDALINEISLSRMRVFLSDVHFVRSTDGNKIVTIPFCGQDYTAFRKVLSTEDTIQEFAPALRTSSQIGAFRVALQMLGDLCGLGEAIPDEGVLTVVFDDSIIQDATAEKAQDMQEVGVTMSVVEFRQKWYGEDETTSRPGRMRRRLQVLSRAPNGTWDPLLRAWPRGDLCRVSGGSRATLSAERLRGVCAQPDGRIVLQCRWCYT